MLPPDAAEKMAAEGKDGGMGMGRLDAGGMMQQEVRCRAT